MNKPITNKAEAVEEFRRLVARWGLRWAGHMNIPEADYRRKAECNRFLLTEADRRAALGFPRT